MTSPSRSHQLDIVPEAPVPRISVWGVLDASAPEWRADRGWALEIWLDVQWTHAIAPGAKILLVEASSNSFANLLAAEDYAKANAQYVSNRWGGSEFSGESAYDSHFASPA